MFRFVWCNCACKKFEFFKIYESLKKYGKMLLNHLPEQVLDCLKKIIVLYPGIFVWV